MMPPCRRRGSAVLSRCRSPQPRETRMSRRSWVHRDLAKWSCSRCVGRVEAGTMLCHPPCPQPSPLRLITRLPPSPGTPFCLLVPPSPSAAPSTPPPALPRPNAPITAPLSHPCSQDRGPPSPVQSFFTAGNRSFITSALKRGECPKIAKQCLPIALKSALGTPSVP